MSSTRVLYLLGSAAPPVLDVGAVVERAQGQGWDVCLGLTPTAARWLESALPTLAALTGHPVRSAYRLPHEPDPWPPATVALLAPATFNTLNSWALGLTGGSFIVGFAAEAIGKGIPLVTMPCVNSAFLAHPQFDRSIRTLRGAGVRVLLGEGGFVPNRPGEGNPTAYPWEAALNAVSEMVS
ncbi:flavoprotein [Streptacidiphilus sp. P02-A3a]|uniref:flavoprotein n=1 Tax=Streptacidiphilus sp. P02-A3a TaxID=2704468 RepID=UPI0015F80591|nr:flavoprotein [Streptacidiphilus sp. P02-A3a]QMU68660.1 flavoprotein [Streptacidiphilus sp. P02-A3a]